MSAPRVRSFGKAVVRSPTGTFGVLVVGVLIVVAIVGTFWTPFEPQTTDTSSSWLLPFQQGHVLGTDRVGRDQLSILMVGARQAVVVAAGTALLSGALGIALAVLIATTPRPVSAVLRHLLDVVVAIPVLLLVMVLTAVYHPSTWLVVIALSINFSLIVARVVRAELRSALASDYVLAARAAGAGSLRIVRKHLLPALAPTLIVQLSLVAALAVLAEAGLSYLGYGAPASTPSWGALLHEQQSYIAVRPLLVVWPGLAVALTVMGLNLAGDALRDAVDPWREK